MEQSMFFTSIDLKNKTKKRMSYELLISFCLWLIAYTSFNLCIIVHIYYPVHYSLNFAEP